MELDVSEPPERATSQSEGGGRQVQLILRSLFEVAASTLCCWPILLVPVVLAALATLTDQGREAITANSMLVALNGPSWHTYAAQAVSTVFATLAALVLLTPTDDAPPEGLYAAQFVPALIGLLTGYSPLISFDLCGVGRGNSGFWMALARIVPPVFILIARDALPQFVRCSRPFPRWHYGVFALPLLLFWLSDLSVPYLILGFAVSVAGIYFFYGDREARKIPLVGIPIVVVLLILSFAGFSATILLLTCVLAFAIADVVLMRRADQTAVRVHLHAMYVVAAIALVGGVAVALDPAGLGLAMGTYATVIVALNAYLAFGILVWRMTVGLVAIVATSLAWRAAIRRGALWGGLASAALIYLVLTGPFGLAEIRTMLAPPTVEQPIETYATDWLTARQNEINATNGKYSVFLVTADGGGIRSAWWTARLLGSIQEVAPDFSRHIFAMSGVSGGSLGTATFAAQVALSVDPATPRRLCAGMRWAECAEKMLGMDLLAPALAGMLIVDIPRSILRTHFFSDRAAALEKGFEAAWLLTARTNSFGDPFTDLWRGDRRYGVPLLLLNTTDAATGRRLVLAPVTIGESTGDRGDLANLLNTNSLRLSTAVLLSARFPGVSPAAWIPLPGTDKGYAVVDGGYADNSGAGSAAEALAAFNTAVQKLQLTQRIRVVAMMIANDPLPREPPPKVPRPGERTGVSTLGSLFVPVDTLDRLRQANTTRAKKAFEGEIRKLGGVVLNDFDLEEEAVREGTTAFPLGWMLTQKTRDAMKAQQDRMLKPKSDLCQAIQLVSTTALPPACGQ